MTVAFVPVSFGYGTTMRCLAVAAELRRRGSRSVFLAGESVRPMICRHGFVVRSIPDVRIHGNGHTLPARQLFDQEDAPGFLACQLGCLIDDLRAIDARVVVYSHSLTAPLAASILDLPSVSIFNPSILGVPSLAFLVPMLHAWLRFVLLRRRSRLGYPVESAFLGTRSFIPGIPPLVNWPTLLPPGLWARRDQGQPVGALLPRSPADLPPGAVLTRELGIGERSFVYATVGGAIFNLDLVRSVADGIRRANCAGLVSGGSVVTDEVSRRLSDDRVRVVRFVPDDLRAIKAARALIWHGGHQTMMETVACGTPAIGLPYQLDQFSNVDGIVREGAGARLDPHGLEADDLAGAIDLVVGESRFRRAMERLQRIDDGYRGVAAVADAVQTLEGVATGLAA
ncbi:MAG: glycosyltransferase [Chloroflexota bacterium]